MDRSMIRIRSMLIDKGNRHLIGKVSKSDDQRNLWVDVGQTMRGNHDGAWFPFLSEWESLLSGGLFTRINQ